MKKIITFYLIFIFLNILIFPQINQGDVVINSFDPSLNRIYNSEFVVLVNRTVSPVDLFGYELRCFDYEGMIVTTFVTFNTHIILPPYGFYLISNELSVYGVTTDYYYGNGHTTKDYMIDADGYLTFRKIGATQSSDYVDIVKYCRISHPTPNPAFWFTGIPPNSGINPDLSMPVAVHDFGNPPAPGTYLTRGGVTGNFSSLNYSDYGMVGESGSDFFGVTEANNSYIQNLSSSPLPVELSAFTAISKQGQVILKWETKTETNNYGFEVERKVSESWEKIGFVSGNGNSNSPKEYSYLDKNLIGGSKFQYRLKQIDNDGQYEYSAMVEANVVPTEYTLYQNYPNPFNPNTKIRYQLPQESKVVIKIYSILGSEIMELLNEQKEAGIYEIEFGAENLSSGTYIYKISANNFVQTKKMILLK